MKILEQKHKCKCDINNCTNFATYVITEEGVMANRRINMCVQCADELSEQLKKLFVPKSPCNMIKKSREKR